MHSFKLFFTILVLWSTNGGLSSLDNSVSVTPTATNDNWESSLYFNTQFLLKYDLVAKTLIEQEGFEECNFITSDNIRINGLWKQSDNARATLLLCAGFYPGRKESLASFLHVAPADCNLLLIDARGHGKSGGQFLSNLHNYGIHEYKDIIASIQFIKNKTDCPIFILGICAGAFHAARALIELGATNINQFGIKGLIFDSGITSLESAMNVPSLHVQEKMLPAWLQSLYIYDTKKEVKERFIYKMCASMINRCINALIFCLKPFIQKHEIATNIFDKIHTISCPVLYIHALNDTYCPFESIEKLNAMTQKSACWFIEKSEHALNQFKYKEEYQKRLTTFIQNNY